MSEGPFSLCEVLYVIRKILSFLLMISSLRTDREVLWVYVYYHFALWGNIFYQKENAISFVRLSLLPE